MPKDRRAVAVFALLVGVWLAAGLFGRDPWKPDEAYTFGLVRSILQTGDWVVPTLAGEPFMEKPPLFFVSAALFASLFGGWLAPHDAARLATALYSGLTLLFVWLAARRLFGRGAGIAAVLALMGCIGYFHTAHLLVTDNALVAGIAIGLYGLARALERPASGGLLLGTGAGIAFLSKGLIGPGVLAATALALTTSRAWRTRAYLQALVFALAAFAPWGLIWPGLLYQRSPALFHEWLVVNNFGRYTGAAKLGPELDHWMYLKILPWFALPALPLALFGAWHAARERSYAAAIPGAAALVMLAVLSSACNSRYLYALPMFVPLSILAGASIDRAPQWLSRSIFWSGALLGACAIAALWLAWAVAWRDWPLALAGTLRAFRPGFEAWWQPLPVVLAAAATIGGFLGLRAASRTAFAAPAAWAVSAAAAWSVFFTLWLPYQDYGNSYRSLVAELQSRLPRGAGCIANRGLGEPQRAMLEYFGGIVTLAENDPGARRCGLLLVQQRPGAGLPARPTRWVPVWSGARPGDPNERFWLFALARQVPDAQLEEIDSRIGVANSRVR